MAEENETRGAIEGLPTWVWLLAAAFAFGVLIALA
jgi:hypothetical protein